MYGKDLSIWNTAATALCTLIPIFCIAKRQGLHFARRSADKYGEYVAVQRALPGTAPDFRSLSG
jgi:hypothetical protein